MKRYLLVATMFVSVMAPALVSAHEVYVLTPAQVSEAIATPSPNPFGAIPGQEKLFLIWGTGVAVLLLIVLSVSVSRFFERVFDPFLMRLKRYAPFIARVTFGVSLIASGWFHDFFGPELPIHTVLSPLGAHLMSVLMIVAGVFLLFGFLTRLMSVVMIVAFGLAVYHYGLYMLMYVNYLGEALLMLILGGGLWSVDRHLPMLRGIDTTLRRSFGWLEAHSFLILRVLFGVAVFSASFYAKFLHSNLALDTVLQYHLTDYFHFTPLFLVLGAFIIEAMLGLCLAIGFELRFASIFFVLFMTQSLLFFGESVWPHIILFGLSAVVFAHGYDRYTLERALFQKKRRGEPVL